MSRVTDVRGRRRRQERTLYLPLVKGANAEGWHLYRINDGSPGKNPFDIAGADPAGCAVGLEVKVVDRLDLDLPLPSGLFDTHQWEWLVKFAQAPLSRALVGIWEDCCRSMWVFEFRLVGYLHARLREVDGHLLTHQTSRERFEGWRRLQQSRPTVYLGPPDTTLQRSSDEADYLRPR